MENLTITLLLIISLLACTQPTPAADAGPEVVSEPIVVTEDWHTGVGGTQFLRGYGKRLNNLPGELLPTVNGVTGHWADFRIFAYWKQTGVRPKAESLSGEMAWCVLEFGQKSPSPNRHRIVVKLPVDPANGAELAKARLVQALLWPGENSQGMPTLSGPHLRGAEAPFLKGLIEMGQRINQNPSARVCLLWEPGGNPAHAPFLCFAAKNDGQTHHILVGPGLQNVHRPLLIELKSSSAETQEDLPSGISVRLAAMDRKGYELLSLGQEGLIFQSRDQPLRFGMALFQHIDPMTKMLVPRDDVGVQLFTSRQPLAVPFWVQAGQKPGQPIVPWSDDRVAIALSVCGEELWSREAGYTADPELWAVPIVRD